MPRTAATTRGHHEKLERVDRQGFYAVDLLGCAHVREYRADPRSDAAGHEESGDKRADFDEKRQCLNRRYHRGCTKRHERAARVQSHYCSERETRGDHEEEETCRANLGSLSAGSERLQMGGRNHR